MLIPSDYRDLLRILNKHKVRYLIVGAYAVVYYTEPRFTKDLDIWVSTKPDNAKRVYAALKEFGAPLKGISPEDFTNKNLFYQIGIAPVRVDIIMDIVNLGFDIAWKYRSITNIDGIKANILGINELIESKKKMKRDIDNIDLKNLEYMLKRQLKRRK